MTRLEKHSFYSFLGLYIISSFFLISLVGYWYFTSQREMLKSQIHYKLEHMVDQEANKVTYAHMQHTKYQYAPPMGSVKISLIDMDGKVAYGDPVPNLTALKPGLKIDVKETTLVSDATRGHLGIELVVARTTQLNEMIADLRQRVLRTMLLVMLMVSIVAWILSRIFMRPLRQRVSQIETFINDVTHELNTPITSLSMATRQAMDAGTCTDRTLKNISISTRQLYDIYRSLTYLNFSRQDTTQEAVDLSTVLKQSIGYYSPLAEIKRIALETEITSCRYLIPEREASLLFGNLIGNAIKYSPAGATVQLSLKSCQFEIRDNGIGIDKKKQKEIFEKFRRATKQSGGFGIGLSVVKSICERYAIALALDSAPGRGTTFKLSFINQK